MHVGFVSGSPGHTVAQFCRGVAHLDVSFTVITDRLCGIEDVARSRGIPCRRIPRDGREFSLGAAEVLGAEPVAFALLYFDRLVSSELFALIPTHNIDPSLLPAFAGFGAPHGSARERDVRFVGATLHLAIGEPDGGPIVAQVCAPVWPRCQQPYSDELSFAQRVCLSLLSVELARDDALIAAPADGTVRYGAERPYADRCKPGLRDLEMLKPVRELEKARDMRVTG